MLLSASFWNKEMSGRKFASMIQTRPFASMPISKPKTRWRVVVAGQPFRCEQCDLLQTGDDRRGRGSANVRASNRGGEREHFAAAALYVGDDVAFARHYPRLSAFSLHHDSDVKQRAVDASKRYALLHEIVRFDFAAKCLYVAFLPCFVLRLAPRWTR